jgi:hypothetical protein
LSLTAIKVIDKITFRTILLKDSPGFFYGLLFRPRQRPLFRKWHISFRDDGRDNRDTLRVSDDAMDDADGKRGVASRKRREQFEGLKPRIVEHAKRKYLAAAFERSGPLILVNTSDMSY